jgi:hypothetical protein
MPIARRAGDLLGEIEAAALDPSSDLPAVLRKCITLGSVTGSERLREWAVRELKGYGPDDTLPPYREVSAPLQLDGATYNGMVRNQAVPAALLPSEVRDLLTDQVHFPQPIAELADLLSEARNRGEGSIRIGVPAGPALVALMNHKLSGSYRLVESVFWCVSLSPIARILDVVRTNLVELVAEMRAGMPAGSGLPSHEATEQAVDIAIHGKRNRVVVVHQVGSDGQVAAATGGAAAVGTDAESPGRRVMWWVVGVAGVVAAVAAVWLVVWPPA